MNLSREEKEKHVLELYYEKTYTYREIAKELKMSPNQIRDVIRRHEEKSNAKANKKRKELSLSSKAYKLFSKGKTSMEVAIKLDITQTQVTQFLLQYWKLVGQDKLVTLHALLGDRIFSLSKLYKELIIKRGMSIERVANLIETALYKLPYVETLFEQASQAEARKREKVDYLENRIRTLKEEKRNKMVTLSPSHYYYPNDRENYASKSPSYSSSFSSQPSSLPYSHLDILT
jgi:DNA-binding CsgD family transcriptional regulator